MCPRYVEENDKPSIVVAVSKENDIFQFAKKPIRDGRLALPDHKNEFCWGTFHIKKSPLWPWEDW